MIIFTMYLHARVHAETTFYVLIKRPAYWQRQNTMEFRGNPMEIVMCEYKLG